MKIPQRFGSILALLLVADVVFLLAVYFCPPRQQCGLTNLFFSFIVAIANAVVSGVMLLLKKKRWSLAFFVNAVLMLFAVNYAAGISSRLYWEMHPSGSDKDAIAGNQLLPLERVHAPCTNSTSYMYTLYKPNVHFVHAACTLSICHI
jgi:hypothetical protein